MRINQIIDDYITREESEFFIGHCVECGDVIEDSMEYQEVSGKLYCNEECVHSYFGVEFKNNIIYCDCCDYPVDDNYIEDKHGSIFCNIKCLTEFYNE